MNTPRRILKAFWLFHCMLIWSACTGQAAQQKDQKAADNLYQTDKDDVQMNHAIATAKRTITWFDSAFASGMHGA